MPTQNNLSIYERYQRYSTYLTPIVSDPLIRSYFGLVASILLIAFFLFFALSPTFNTILGLQKKIQDDQTIDAALQQKISDIIHAQDVYSQIQPQLNLLDQAMPDKPFPQGLIADILNSASSSGVVLSSLQFQSVPLTADAVVKNPSVNGVPAVTFSVSIAGSNDQIRQFLGNLESRLRYIRIQNITVNFGTKVGSVTADITGTGFYIGF